MSKAPEGKTDILIRMDVALKMALAERARVENRSVSNMLVHAAETYLAKAVAAWWQTDPHYQWLLDGGREDGEEVA